MGLLSTIVAYKVGKRAGRKRAERRARDSAEREGHPDCVNYASFCENYGSCDGMTCEFDDEYS